MALRNQPYIPLYVDDYLTDEKLNECSASTQGVYIKLLCLMHKSDPYGTILLKQKHKQKTKQTSNFACQLARNLLFTEGEIEAALDELIAEKVIILEADKLIQKRMVKDNDISEKRKIAGFKGGQKSILSKQNQDFVQAKVQANSGNVYVNGDGIGDSKEENINTPQVALRSPVHHNENSAEMQGYFDAFFRKYPRPEGEDDARRAYFDVVHNPSDAVGILSALNNYLKSDAVRANYVKLPAKWIRDWKTWLHPTPAMMQGGKQKEKEIPRPVARSKQEEEAAFEKLNSELLRREGVDVKAVNKSNGTKSAVDDSKTLTEEEIQRKKEEARKKLMEEK